MFDVNITTVIQFINFAVTIFVLDFLLIRPIRGIVKKRRDLASGMINDAKQFADDANNKLAAYEAALMKTREEAALVREEHKQMGVAEETALLHKAQADAQEFLKTSREETAKAVTKAMADMKKRTPDLAKLAVAKLLGTKAA